MRDRDEILSLVRRYESWLVVLAWLVLQATSASAEILQLDSWVSGDAAVFQGGFITGEREQGDFRWTRAARRGRIEG